MEALGRDGFVIVEDALTRRQLARLRAAVDRVWRSEAPGRELHRLAFVGLDDSFLDLLVHDATLPVVRRALGDNIYVYHCHLDVHPPLDPPTEPRWRWHQDGGRQNVDLESPRPRLSLKVAYFLTAVNSVEHGPMSILPGSHRRETLARPANGSVNPPGAVPLLVRAGTAVIFDRRLWHARGDNVSTRARKVLFYAYTYRWIRERDDVEVDAARLASLDPVRRQLLGAGASAIGRWFPTDDEVPLRGDAGAAPM